MLIACHTKFYVFADVLFSTHSQALDIHLRKEHGYCSDIRYSFLFMRFYLYQRNVQKFFL